MGRDIEKLRIEDKLHVLYLRQEIIENQRDITDVTFCGEELKQIEDEISYLIGELNELYREE